MKNKPWIEDNDPIKEYYCLLTDEDKVFFQSFFENWYNRTSRDFDIKNIKSGKKLLEFSDNYNEYCQFTMYEKICSLLDDGEYIYWIPMTDSKERLFADYEPMMIAKTPIKINIMNSVRRSFMQMLKGEYMLFDSQKRFISIVVDGYYMLMFLKNEYMNDEFVRYIENWDSINNNLDDIKKEDLFVKLSCIGSDLI